MAFHLVKAQKLKIFMLGYSEVSQMCISVCWEKGQRSFFSRFFNMNKCFCNILDTVFSFGGNERKMLLNKCFGNVFATKPSVRKILEFVLLMYEGLHFTFTELGKMHSQSK